MNHDEDAAEMERRFRAAQEAATDNADWRAGYAAGLAAGRQQMQERAAKLITEDTPVFSDWQARAYLSLAERIRGLTP